MRIRPMTYEDIPAVFAVHQDAFRDDGLYAWLWPKKDTYPDDLRRWQLLRIKIRLVQPDQYGLVVETEDENPKIAGYAIYKRFGDDAQARSWYRDTVFKRLERFLLGLNILYEKKIFDRAADQSANRQFALATDFNYYRDLPSCWHLALLGVSSGHRRQGIGAMLVNWGRERAQEEQVPVTLEASPMGRGLYESLGFRVIEKTLIAEDIKGIAMLFEPESARGVWLEEHDGSFRLKSRKGESEAHSGRAA